MDTIYDDEKRVAVLKGGQIIYSVHKSTQCLGEVCPIHKPSDHEMREYDLTYNPMVGSFFRKFHGELVVDPDDYNLNRFGEVILKNAARCLLCDTVVESTFRHDFKSCPCGAVSVDGGSAYLRRLANAGTFEDLSIVFEKE